jgi:hypothetical protein
MILTSVPWPKNGLAGEKYRSCTWCGDNAVTYALDFDSGSVAPIAGETLTGATSGDTAVVVSVNVESGSWAGGDAAGVIELSSGTGVDDDGYIFQDNEEINGGTGGNNMLTANGKGSKHGYGRLYPETLLIERDGKRYCNDHYFATWPVRDWCDMKVDIKEGDDE